MISLDELSIKYNSDKGTLKHNYTLLYNLVFRPEWTSILEIGVDAGASIYMWLDYFPNAEVYGIDINPSPIKNNRYTHVQGDQSKGKTYTFFKDKKFDLIIDDGSHCTEDIKYSFKKLHGKLKSDGIYIVEDLDCGRANDAIEILVEKGFYIINNKIGIYCENRCLHNGNAETRSSGQNV